MYLCGAFMDMIAFIHGSRRGHQTPWAGIVASCDPTCHGSWEMNSVLCKSLCRIIFPAAEDFFFQEFPNHFYLLNFKMFTETFFLISVSSSRFPPFISPPLGKQKGVDGNPWTLKLYCSRRVEETVALKFKCLVWMAPIFLRDRADVRYEQATFI